MVVDTVIKNCIIVSPRDIFSAGIAINNGKIVAVADDTALPEARKIIDARGNHVLPGIIDTHTHPGYGHPLPRIL